MHQISFKPNNVTFIQWYVDFPHKRTKANPHALSGCIATIGLLHHQKNRKMARDAREFLNLMTDNALKIGPSHARIEVVTLLTDPGPQEPL